MHVSRVRPTGPAETDISDFFCWYETRPLEEEGRVISELWQRDMELRAGSLIAS